MSGVTVAIPAGVLEVLALPALDGLADDKVRGAECLWCDKRLTGDTAVDFGQQRSPLNGSSAVSGMTWFPRACRSCVADRAHRGLFTHTVACPLCQAEQTAADCIVGRGLYRLVRDCRR
ncbi:hypothetical protein ACJ6WF_16180 [Streptomyces sp. MMS24-I2-30]|uniref:hypothetical protein n=1 Tax=Streptomyces sp. MMS24-I2-30 TaxID=3351564 RepID=UPI0038969A3A